MKTLSVDGAARDATVWAGLRGSQTGIQFVSTKRQLKRDASLIAFRWVSNWEVSLCRFGTPSNGSAV